MIPTTVADANATGENALMKSAAAAPRSASGRARHAGMATIATLNSVPNQQPAARMWSASDDTASTRRCVAAAACPLNENDSASTSADTPAMRQRAASPLTAAAIATIAPATSNSHAHPQTVVAENPAHVDGHGRIAAKRRDLRGEPARGVDHEQHRRHAQHGRRAACRCAAPGRDDRRPRAA